MIEDINGEPIQALTVFAMSIRYLNQQVQQTVKDLVEPQKGLDVRDIDMLYVITVPAIWDNRARQFMREAASLVCLLLLLSISIRLLSVLRGHSFFHPRHNGQ